MMTATMMMKYHSFKIVHFASKTKNSPLRDLNGQIIRIVFKLKVIFFNTWK